MPAIALERPKGVGKTATAARRADTTFRLDDPAQRVIADDDPRILLEAAPPILSDEWQHVPAIWDSVRRAMDVHPASAARRAFAWPITALKSLPPGSPGSGI